MNADVRAIAEKLKASSPEEIAATLEAAITFGRSHWDGYYSQSPLLEWFAEGEVLAMNRGQA